MSGKHQLQESIAALDPEEALAVMAEALKKLFPLLSEASRHAFMVALLGAAGGDKVSSMVHL